jgi:hypothetical protein
MRGALQKRPTQSIFGRRKPHMRGKLIGEPADFAPAHRIRLSGQGQRPRPWDADAASCKMAIDDRVDLVGALPGLVDPLAIEGDYAGLDGLI